MAADDGQHVYPVSTLIQAVHNKPFVVRHRTTMGRRMKRLEFRVSLTLLMDDDNQLIQDVMGNAKIEVHRKFMPQYEKFLHWIKIVIGTDGPTIKAQLFFDMELACNHARTTGFAFIQDERPKRVTRRPRTRPTQNQ